MDKASLSRSNSSNSLDQFKEEDKKQTVEKHTTPTSKDHAVLPGSDQPRTAMPAIKDKPVKPDAESASGRNKNYGSKTKLEIKSVILPSSDPTLSPRASSSISLGGNRSILTRTDTNNSAVPSLVSLSPTNVPAISTASSILKATTSTTATMSNTGVDKNNNQNTPAAIAGVLIKAETAAQGVPYKKQMTSGAVDRILRGKVEDNGINLIETKLVPFVEKQFGTSEYGNLFRELDKRFLELQPEIEKLRNAIKAEMENPIEYTDALMQKDPRLGKILDPVIRPLIEYITSDDTIKGSNLPAPFLQLLKATDNEILTWYKTLTEDAKKSGGAVPSQADLATARKNAMVALIGIRSLSVILSKLHGSQVRGKFSMLENHLIKTINIKCVSLAQNVMNCPNDDFEKLLVDKRAQQITRKSSMRMRAPDEGSEKSFSHSEKELPLSMSPRGPVRKESSSVTESEKIAEHNQMLVSLFARKYKLTEIDSEFSLIFNKAMSKYIDKGLVNLGERAIKKECLKLLGQHMEAMQRSGMALSESMKDLFIKLSGYSFAELEDAPQSPREVKSPRGMPPKKS